MKCIKTLTDLDFGLIPKEFDNPKIRYGARGIIFNDKGLVAILNKEKKNEFKLIGGGIEEFEDPIRAFRRESLEETGCKIEIDDCLETFKEEKSNDKFKQISNIYIAHVINDGFPSFTKEEIEDGATLLWLPIDDAIQKIQECEQNLKASSHEKYIKYLSY